MNKRYLNMTDRLLVLDFETSSPVDLKKKGLDNYWRHPETKLLMCGFKWADDYNMARIVDFAAGPASIRFSRKLVAEMEAPPKQCMLVAANAPFDQRALARYGIATPDDKWIDVLTLARILGFAGTLDEVLSQTGLGVEKDSKGARLISKFSVQREPWHESPDDWDDFREYCRQDVEVAERLLSWLLTWLDTPRNHEIVRRVLHQESIYKRINARGIPVDLGAVEGAIQIRDKEVARNIDLLKNITGLKNPNSREQLLKWAILHGYTRKDLRKDSIRDELQELKDNPPLGPSSEHSELISALEARQRISKTSTKKFDALINATSPDGRLRNAWQFYGASRTGRVAGRVLNPANLARPGVDDPGLVAEIMANGSLDFLSLMCPEKDVMTTLSSAIRASLKAPEGKRWCVADLSSIESVGLAWLAGCESILQVFREGRDTYKDFATKIFNIPYDQVTKAQRTLAKPAVLGAGYRMSGLGLQAYAAGMGVDLEEEEADRHIAVFRKAYHEIVHYWDRLQWAAFRAIRQPGQTFTVNAVGHLDPVHGYIYSHHPAVTYWCHPSRKFLFCGLPSGRFLAYYKPQIELVEIENRKGEKFQVHSLCYRGRNQKLPGAAWQKLNVHSGSLAENVSQALCRDVLWNGLELAEEDPGLEVVGDVYDEALTLCDADDDTALDRLVLYMTSPPPWVDNRFYLSASGYVAERYRKD